MNIAVPSRPVRPIRAERELREGGTRCSSRIYPRYLLFSLQIRGKNDLSPRARPRWMLPRAPLTSRPARSREVEPEGKGAG